MLAAPLALAILALATALAPATRSQRLAYEAVPVGSFDAPVHVAVAPGEPRFLFVVERAGRVRLLRDEAPLARPFLDISDIVLSKPEDPAAGGEQGMFSIAFAPDYEQSRRFYVVYTNQDGDIEVDEFLRSAEHRGRADPASRRTVIVIEHREALNHYGGQLTFGPDARLLYISVGDGGRVLPLGKYARDLESLLGKILRIDPRPHGGQAYRVPASNPYVGVPGRDEIFAYGLRNPWRFSIDGGRIAIGDVGRAREEEVDFLRLRDAAGVNFGWPEYEGNLPFDPSQPGPDPPTFPIHTYSHEAGRCAITGGFVIRDEGLPELQGRYAYADLCTGEIRTLHPRLSPPGASGDMPLGVTAPMLASFGEGFGGQIYFSELSGGGVYRLEQASP
jgi:glucose/arabinose dehydrogenase